MRGSKEPVEGYEADIHRSVWERIRRMGAPRLWSVVWVVLCLYAALIFLTVLGFRWVLLPGIVWALGQGALVMLTQYDGHWDDLALAQLTRRYKTLYEAG